MVEDVDMESAAFHNNRARLFFLWSVLTVFAFVASAVWRLVPLAIEPIEQNMLTPWHWFVWVIWVVFQLYGEGYRGFQRGFAPRVLVRAHYLANHPRWYHLLLAPLFCMGVIYATRRRKIITCSVIGGITLLVIAVRFVEQPWRGIIDAGVVAGLVWGLVCMVVFTIRILLGYSIDVSPELPNDVNESQA